MDTENNIIVDEDDSSEDSAETTVADRIFEIRDRVSFEIIAKNIVQRFKEPSVIESINYISKFKENYLQAKTETQSDSDKQILDSTLQDLCQLVYANMASVYQVGIGADYDEDNGVRPDEALDTAETLYEFFIVRHYTNIKDYFISNLVSKKLEYVERYKAALDEKTYDDLFLSQDKKKYMDISDAIIIHFINDIIADIRSTAKSGYDLFKDIAETDLFEEYNNRMYELLQNYGTMFVISDDAQAAASYLRILDDSEIYTALRNDMLSTLLQEASLSDAGTKDKDGK